MKPDLYTKIVLTVIALMLTVIATKPFFSPALVQAQQSGGLVAVPFGKYKSNFAPLGVCSNGTADCYVLQWGGR